HQPHWRIWPGPQPDHAIEARRKQRQLHDQPLRQHPFVTLMIPVLEKLIQALRDELTHYGEMLALLDRQQETTIQRLTDEMFAATVAIQNQATVMQTS